MAMSRINNNNVNICLYKCVYTSQDIGCDTNCCTAEKTSLCIFGCQRIFDLFFNVLDGDKTF